MPSVHHPASHHSFIPLSLEFFSPICLQNLSDLLHGFSLLISWYSFHPGLTGSVCPCGGSFFFFTIWLVNERKWEFICFTDREEEQKSQTPLTSSSEKQSVFELFSVGCSQIISDEGAACSVVKLSCSYAKKINTMFFSFIFRGGGDSESRERKQLLLKPHLMINIA